MVNFDGRLVEVNLNTLNHSNRAFRYGDLIHEDLKVDGGTIVFWEAHYFRLMAGMRILRMEIPMYFTMEYLADEILKVVQGATPRLVRLSVFRKNSASLVPETHEVSFVVEVVNEMSPFYMMPKPLDEVALFKDHYLGKGLLSQLELGQKAVEILAGIFAEENGYDDCLLLNTDKNMVGAITGNLFLVKDGLIKTPPLSDGAKNRVIRAQLIEILSKIEEFELSETSISPFELQKADELFVASITKGIQSIGNYRKKRYETAVAERLLGLLNTKIRLSNLE